MTPIDAVTDMLAVYRLTRLVQEDRVWPMPELRAKAEEAAEGTRWAELIHCQWCLSVWVGAGVAVANAVAPRPWRIVSRVLAASAVTGVVSTIID